MYPYLLTLGFSLWRCRGASTRLTYSVSETPHRRKGLMASPAGKGGSSAGGQSTSSPRQDVSNRVFLVRDLHAIRRSSAQSAKEKETGRQRERKRGAEVMINDLPRGVGGMDELVTMCVSLYSIQYNVECSGISWMP
ncbi:hypothetical protein GGR56DRAFT_97079 [Xylariaceae sp. FL0804]|nr:hypothetical protein GGR56DRAFT_97079 [Xylariaceae sp. FL0804]